MTLDKRLLRPVLRSVCVWMVAGGVVFASQGPSEKPDSPGYKQLQAHGLLPASQQVTAPLPSGTEPPVESLTMPALLIPRDGSFLVAPITSGTAPLYRNDDGSTDTIALPFTFKFFGSQHRRVFINNNGNISFLQGYGTYSSTGFPITGYDMIAAFWADVDTRNDTSGVVYYRVEAHRLVVIWDQVGYYGSRADKLNTFEIIITDGTDPLIGIGKNVALSYSDMQWTTGDASSGVNGFYGTAATVGANKGDGTNYALIGRFDHAGTDYDGPGGGVDGVSYLDNRLFTFNIAQGLGTIAGTVFHDLNGNCIKDTLESALRGWTVRLDPTGAFTTTDSLGKYLFSFLDPGTYTVSEVIRPNWQRSCPTGNGTYTVNLDSGQTVGGRVFANVPVTGAQDLAVSVAGGTARRGGTKQYGIRVDNLGSVALPATVRFFLPPQVTHSQASSGGVYNSGGWVDWSPGTLNAGATAWLWERVQIPPSVPLNTVLVCSVAVSPLTGDVSPANNGDSESETVLGSFDPNDIQVDPVGEVTPATVLTYTIRFQNTGNDTAFVVRILDSLESDFDLSTVEPGASSHPYVFQISAPNELVFRFDNINLPDSGTSFPLSQGFVTYTVRPRLDVIAGASLSNRAAIYFDLNTAVFTNTVTNTIGGGWAVYPGDADNDGLVDVRDILPLGRFFGLAGPGRSNASLNWTPQSVLLPWTPEEAVYADCDGNGTVEGNDVQAILTNWFRTHTNPGVVPVDRRAVCEELLAEIDRNAPLSSGMKEIRRAVIVFMKRELGVVFTYALEQNWPNPFNPSTSIRFTIPEPLPEVRLTVFDMLGQRIWERTMTDVEPGAHRVQWEGVTSSGSKASSGVYFYRLNAGAYSAVHRMLLLK
jgi:uncharacterized repeat protein (TIGR01451 family)